MSDHGAVERLLPGMTPAVLMDQLDTTHVAHGPLNRLPELDFVFDTGGVPQWLRFLARRGRRVFTVKNIDWTHPAARQPARGFLTIGADVDMALRFLNRGATVTAEAIDREVEEFRPLLHRLCRELGHPIGEDAGRIDMLAGPPGLCTEMHTDADYAINLQIFGGKRWRTMLNSLSHPPDGCNDEDTPVDLLRVSPDNDIPVRIAHDVHAFETHPGTAVWRQTGVWHETANTGDTLNLSIVLTLYGRGRNRDLCKRLVNFLHRQPGWRAPMFGARGEPEHQRAYRARVAALLSETFGGPRGATAAEAYYDLPPSLGSRARFRPAPGVIVRPMLEDGRHRLEVETAEAIGELELQGSVDTLEALVKWSLTQVDGFDGADIMGHLEVIDRHSAVHVDDVAQLVDGLCSMGALVREPSRAELT